MEVNGLSPRDNSPSTVAVNGLRARLGGDLGNQYEPTRSMVILNEVKNLSLRAAHSQGTSCTGHPCAGPPRPAARPETGTPRNHLSIEGAPRKYQIASTVSQIAHPADDVATNGTIGVP